MPRVLLKKNPKKSLKLQKTKVILFYSITQQIKYKFNHMEMESNLVIDYEQLVSIYPINYNSNQTIYTLKFKLIFYKNIKK